MTEAGAPKRLNKVAVEFNVAVATIVEYLGSQGVVVENKPTTKISDDAYETLLKKFQPDKLDKMKSNTLNLTPLIQKEERTGKDARQEEAARHAAAHATQTAPAAKPSPVVVEPAKPAPVVVELPKPEPEVVIQPVPVKAEPVPEPAKVETPPVAQTPKPSAVAPVEEDHQFKVVGNFDLSSLNRPRKRAEPEDVPVTKQDNPQGRPVESTPNQESKPVQEQEKEVVSQAFSPAVSETPVAKEIPRSEPEAEVRPVQAVPAQEEPKPTIDSEVRKPEEKVTVPESADSSEAKLTPSVPKQVSEPPAEEKMGLTIVGKIDLDQFKPKKKPVASTDDPNGTKKKRRKRKRIPLDTDKAAEELRNNPNQPGGGQGGQGGPGGNRPPFQGQSGSPRPPFQQGNRPPFQQGPGGNRPPFQQGQGANAGPRPPFNGPNGPPIGPRPPRPGEKAPLDDKQIQEEIKRTLNKLTGKTQQQQNKSRLKKKKKDFNRQRNAEQDILPDGSIIQVTEFITVNEMANLMNVPVTAVITTCLNLGLMVSINQRLDAETITVVADEFGFEVEFKEAEMDEPNMEELDNPDNLIDRPPIVTIMGHVDHGKTSLLDYIRRSNIIAGEAGGITQHIGAYEVTLDNGKKITFLDTPGHEAFTAMRARGAKVTDIAVIVIAADDSVMPQTREAISHAQAAGVPLIFAINKIDKDGADPQRVIQQLSEMNILVEAWGGKYQSQEISAKKGLHVDLLLEKILLEAELLELKADPDKRAVGTVIEATMDKGKGIVASVMVEKGTLKVGDPILAGANFGKVKAMYNERGQKVKTAGPATPVQVLGFDGAPTAGDKFYVTESEQYGKEIASKRRQLLREQGIRAKKHITLDEIGRRLAIGNFKELNLIIKGDVDGSVEALSDSLLRLSTEEIQVNVIFKSVGQISESDVLLASASDAIIIGFQVRPSPSARKLAENEEIDIRLYSIIYDAIEEVKAAMEGMLTPTHEEKIVSNVEVRNVFKITKVGTVAGAYVLDGKINRNSKVRLVRDGVVVYTGELDTLKRFKDDVKEVATGYECGLTLRNYNDIQEGDIIEAFEIVEVARKL